MEVQERREVRVKVGDSTFAFAADPDAGRLVIREEPADGDAGEEVCALTVDDREELRAFLAGLRRVLGDELGAPAQDASPEHSSPPGRARRDDRDPKAIDRARQRHANAFKAWTPEEDAEVAEAAKRGESPAAIAKRHGRSERAIAMRLEKLGVKR